MLHSPIIHVLKYQSFAVLYKIYIIYLNSVKVRILEDKAFLFVAWEQRLDVSLEANIQPAATKVTNRDALSFRIRLFCLSNNLN